MFFLFIFYFTPQQTKTKLNLTVQRNAQRGFNFPRDNAMNTDI